MLSPKATGLLRNRARSEPAGPQSSHKTRRGRQDRTGSLTGLGGALAAGAARGQQGPWAQPASRTHAVLGVPAELIGASGKQPRVDGTAHLRGKSSFVLSELKVQIFGFIELGTEFSPPETEASMRPRAQTPSALDSQLWQRHLCSHRVPQSRPS